MDTTVRRILEGEEKLPEAIPFINNLLGIAAASTQRAYSRGELTSTPYIELIDAQPKEPKGIPLKPEQLAACTWLLIDGTGLPSCSCWNGL